MFSSGAPRASEREGGRGTLSRPIRNALAYPSMGGGDRIRIRIRILAFNRVAKYMRNGATPKKSMFSGDALLVSALVPLCAARGSRCGVGAGVCAQLRTRVLRVAGTLGR